MTVAVPISMAVGTLTGRPGAESRLLWELCQRFFDIIHGFLVWYWHLHRSDHGDGWLLLAVTFALFSLPQFGRLAHVYVKLMYTAGPIIMLLLLALAFNLSPRWMPWC